VNQIKFHEMVDGLRPTATGFELSGRCLIGPVCVGDRFTTATTPLGDTVAVELGITDIDFFTHWIYELDPCMTAILHLVGKAPSGLPPGSYLHGQVDRDTRDTAVP
jgi:hypothetical protein